MSRLLAALLVVATAAPVSALTITNAKIDKGAVQVKGKDAVPSAPITWDGKVVGAASKAGAFRFATTEVPTDCVGDVGDGTSVAAAVVAGCSATDRGLVVKDATGRVVGPFVVDSEGYFVTDAVALPSADGAVLSSFGTTSFRAFTPLALFYESDDCSGTALLATEDRPVLRVVGERDGVLYYPRRTGVSATFKSFEERGAIPSGCATPGRIFTPPDRCCCTAPTCMTAQAKVAAAPGTVDVSGFVPPFRVETR